MRTLTILLFSALFFSCKSEEKKKNDNIPELQGKNVPDYNLTQTTKHYFSDPKQKDSFVIRLRGHSVLNGKLAFEIFDPHGKRIFREDFPARYFLNYDVNEPSSDSEKEAFILKRMKEFFKEENFSTPAIKDSDTLNPEYADKAAWDDIKSDPTAVGFYFQLGQEDGRSIAYSKRDKKVTTYFNCC